MPAGYFGPLKYESVASGLFIGVIDIDIVVDNLGYAPKCALPFICRSVHAGISYGFRPWAILM